MEDLRKEDEKRVHLPTQDAFSLQVAGGGIVVSAGGGRGGGRSSKEEEKAVHYHPSNLLADFQPWHDVCPTDAQLAGRENDCFLHHDQRAACEHRPVTRPSLLPLSLLLLLHFLPQPFQAGAGVLCPRKAPNEGLEEDGKVSKRVSPDAVGQADGPTGKRLLRYRTFPSRPRDFLARECVEDSSMLSPSGLRRQQVLFHQLEDSALEQGKADRPRGLAEQPNYAQGEQDNSDLLLLLLCSLGGAGGGESADVSIQQIKQPRRVMDLLTAAGRVLTEKGKEL
mmetsp:Transcript_13675/g.47429  ORF Transcript_13675/g.47429 Transcript_13675/m.47429 type:complete len:281 (+) Transcript_13675:2087-2929(+)